MKRYVRKMTPRTEIDLQMAIQEAGEVLPPEVIEAHLEHAQATIRTCAYGEGAEV